MFPRSCSCSELSTHRTAIVACIVAVSVALFAFQSQDMAGRYIPPHLRAQAAAAAQQSQGSQGAASAAEPRSLQTMAYASIPGKSKEAQRAEESLAMENRVWVEGNKKYGTIAEFLKNNAPSQVSQEKHRVAWIAAVRPAKVASASDAKRDGSEKQQQPAGGDKAQQQQEGKGGDVKDAAAKPTADESNNSGDTPPPTQETLRALLSDWRELQSTSRSIQPGQIDQIAKQHSVLNGKWLIFADHSTVDGYWSKVATALVEGNLGASSAKVSPANAREDSHVICVYTHNYQDKQDVMAVREALRALGFKDSLQYKPDVYTYLGIYRDNPYGLKATVYQA